MVHKKSEYRRTFRWKSGDECQAIWEENWKIRKQLKYQEYQHVPFAWENNDDNSDDEESVNNLPPSKLHQKYLELTRLRERNKELGRADESYGVERSFSDKGVQTPTWKHHAHLHLSDAGSPEKGVQTDITIPVTGNMAEVRRNLEDDLRSILSEPVRRSCRKEQRKHSASRGRCRRASPSSSVAEDKKTPRVSSGRRHRSPFAPYGWADQTREIGSKRTFNVKASRNVYPSAMHAKENKQRQASKINASTHTGIHSESESDSCCSFKMPSRSHWMTEYKSSFGGKRNQKSGGRF